MNSATMTLGFVTLADILGWKGIWQSSAHSNPAENLLEVKSDMEQYLKKLHQQHQALEVSSFLQMHGMPLMESASVSDLSKAGLGRSDEELIRGSFVELAIDLISDTFIITSSGGCTATQLVMQAHAAKQLILTCLKKGFLIRGATSYGAYYRKEMVFVGPAIDDSASWHELGEEVGIFLTPKANYTLEKEEIRVDQEFLGPTPLSAVLFTSVPKLKVQGFETYLIDWSEGKEMFLDIIDKYQTILPDIHKKVVFTMQRLKDPRQKSDSH